MIRWSTTMLGLLLATSQTAAAPPQVSTSGKPALVRVGGMRTRYLRPTMDGWTITAQGPIELHLGLRLVAPRRFKWRGKQVNVSATLKGAEEQVLKGRIAPKPQRRARLGKKKASREQALSITLPVVQHEVVLSVMTPRRVEALLRVLDEPPRQALDLGAFAAPRVVVISKKEETSKAPMAAAESGGTPAPAEKPAATGCCPTSASPPEPS